MIKRAFYHKILSEEPKRVLYENHIHFSDVKVGDVFGVRTLLDGVTCSKYVSQNLLMFSERLQESAEAFYEQCRESEKRTEAIEKAVQTQLKFCKPCFEASVQC